jgi:hypothetical protein
MIEARLSIKNRVAGQVPPQPCFLLGNGLDNGNNFNLKIIDFYF